MKHHATRLAFSAVAALALGLPGSWGCSSAGNGASAGGDPPASSGRGGSGGSSSSGRSGGSGAGTSAASGGADGSGGAGATGGNAGNTGGAGDSGAPGAAGSGGSAGPGDGGVAPTPEAGAPDPGPGAPDPGKTGGEPPEAATPPTTDLAQHKQMRAIKLDTTATGAGVMGNVANYPLAVILDGQTFDFSQAMKWGQDIRFSGADGKLLPYAIELWDADAKKAVMWVRVDVKGNDNAQSILMHWGNPTAISAADSKAVFSKDAGFLGVYHLNQDGNTSEGGYPDASWNQAHGTGVKLAPGTRVDARAGHGTRFDNPAGGAAAQIKWVEVAGPKVIKDFGAEEHPVSISAWVFANSWTGYYQTIFSKGDGEYTLQKDYMGRTEVCMSPLTGTNHECAITSAPPTKIWTHYMVMRKNGPYGPNDLALFINGKRATGTTSAGRHVAEVFSIGNQGFRGRERDKKGFDGIIDEVRVMSVDRGADWAKLDYESQKEGSKFLTFAAPQAK